MTDDFASRLGAQGIDVPELTPLPLEPSVAVMGFPSEGDEALAWWRRLRAVHEHTGLWPVVMNGDVGGGPEESGPTERLAKASELYASYALNSDDAIFESQESWLQEDILRNWPSDPRRVDEFRIPYLGFGQAAEVTVALVDAEQGWQVPTLLNYGFWNDCPEPAVHGAVLRHWNDRYGAELVCMDHASLELVMSRPPWTRLEALAFAGEYAGYCSDGMDLYQAEGLPDLAACLINAGVVHFWWD